MSKKKPRTWCLVVDASIAHAAGSLESRHPTGTNCRDFLIAVRGICHRMAWSDSIKAEWEKHESAFALQWRLSVLISAKKTMVANLAGVQTPAGLSGR